MIIPLLQIIGEFSLGDGIAVGAIFVSLATWIIYYRRRFPSQLQESVTLLESKFNAHIKEDNQKRGELDTKIGQSNILLTKLNTDMEWVKQTLVELKNKS